MSPAPVPKHQRCRRRLLITVDSLIPDGEVFVAPIDLLLDSENILQPDLVWVSTNGRCVITDKLLQGPPELIIEILSPGTTRRDRDDKFEIYERHAVSEYWIVDPLEEYLEVYTHQNDHYVRHGVYGAGETFISAVLAGKTVDLNPRLWRIKFTETVTPSLQENITVLSL